MAWTGPDLCLVGHRAAYLCRGFRCHIPPREVHCPTTQEQYPQRLDNDALLPLHYHGHSDGITSVCARLQQMMVVWGGAPSLHLNALSAGAIIGAILGVMTVTALITLLFFYPFLHRRLVLEDWTLRWYHLFLGPALWRRGPVPHCPEENRIVVQNYYRGHLTMEELAARDASINLLREATEMGQRMSQHISSTLSQLAGPAMENLPESSTVNSSTGGPASVGGSTVTSSTASPHCSPTKPPASLQSEVQSPPTQEPTPELPQYKSFWDYCKRGVWPSIRRAVTHGIDQDIVQLQKRDTRHRRTRQLESMHSRAARYDNQTEHLYSFLQVLTASAQSFAHGYSILRGS
jgi:solute carrier family 20 (sodium-dependent phosphate transporter)